MYLFTEDSQPPVVTAGRCHVPMLRKSGAKNRRKNLF